MRHTIRVAALTTSATMLFIGGFVWVVLPPVGLGLILAGIFAGSISALIWGK